MNRNAVQQPIFYLPSPIAPDEIWLPISNMLTPQPRPDYCVSNYGRVFSGFCGRLLSEIHMSGGYRGVHLTIQNPDHRTKCIYLLHRVVMYTFAYTPGCEYLQVDHISGDKFDNRRVNLRWYTQHENMKSAYEMGLCNPPSFPGETNPNAKITNNDARLIAELKSTGKYTNKQISEMTNISIHIVNDISSGRSFPDIGKEYGLDKLVRRRYSDEEVEAICRYFQDNAYKYDNYNELFRNLMKDLFDKDYTDNMYITLFNLLHHITRRNITDKYNF